MTNAELAAPFRELARVMEYLGENPFKARSYARAHDLIRKAPAPLAAADRETLLGMPGIGSAISDKIIALAQTGRLPTLERYRARVPGGVRDLLGVRGLGPKKVRQLVDELGVGDVGELLHAVRENRVVALRGFSDKTQDKLREQLEFHQRSRGHAKFADVERAAGVLLDRLRASGADAAFAGELARQSPVVTVVEIVATPPADAVLLAAGDWTRDGGGGRWRGRVGELSALVRVVARARFAYACVVGSLGPGFRSEHPRLERLDADGAFASEREVFAAAGLPDVPAPQRESRSPWPPIPASEVIVPDDVRGVVHAHTTWSDGSADIRTMATAARDAGYAYLAITDHSKAAGYAGGLQPARLREQIATIRALDAELDGITLFAGTECDILRDGTLDYDDDLLAELDLVIASVHSVLHMSEADATSRILRALEHPRVDILGHPTGRLLLGRPGYPLDVEAVLDACAARDVAVELNASPYRLDLDWTHLAAAVGRGVLVSINPDAHSTAGIGDIRYGVLAAQKAGLRPSECLNARSASEFAAWLRRRRAHSSAGG